MMSTLNGGEEDPWRGVSCDPFTNAVQVELLRDIGFGPFDAETRDPLWHTRAYALAPHVSTLALVYAMRSNPDLLLYEN